MKGFTDSGFFRKGLPVVGLMQLGILVFGAVQIGKCKKKLIFLTGSCVTLYPHTSTVNRRCFLSSLQPLDSHSTCN
jgi:hypothetical protein